tara:strand:- start:174 stop:422 length:249 start_codon:yes stop_codon:yes gene_type:complete
MAMFAPIGFLKYFYKNIFYFFKKHGTMEQMVKNTILFNKINTFFVPNLVPNVFHAWNKFPYARAIKVFLFFRKYIKKSLWEK